MVCLGFTPRSSSGLPGAGEARIQEISGEGLTDKVKRGFERGNGEVRSKGRVNSGGGQKDLLAMLFLDVVLCRAFGVVATCKGVGAIQLPWGVSDLKTISGEDFGPAGLTGREQLCSHEVLEGLVVRNHLNILTRGL
jgi:hypothetical protein